MSLRRFLAPVLCSALALGALAPIPAAAAGKARSDYSVEKAFDVEASPQFLDVMPVVKHWFGGKKPGTPAVVMIMVPGFFGGVGNFSYTGQRLVERAHDLQVWVVERRNNLLENRCGMEKAQASDYQAVQLAAAYYVQGATSILGDDCPSDDPDPDTWNGSSSEFFLSQTEAAGLGMGEWGLKTELEDIRRVVKVARKTYPKAKIVLGGHSLGGMTTQLFAGWRFGKKARSAGWKMLDGLVLIDGAVNGDEWEGEMVPQSFDTRALKDEGGQYYWDDLLNGGSFLLGLLAEIGGLAAVKAPDLESFLWSGLPAPLDWPDPTTCPTNKAVFAGLTDDQTGFSPTFLLHQGTVGPPILKDGNEIPCAGAHSDRSLVGWADFDDPLNAEGQEISSTDVWAHSMFDLTESNAVEWYFSTVLNADIDIASNLDTKAQFTHGDLTSTASDEYGLREFDTARVKLPVYGFISAFCRDNYDWYRDQAVSVTSFTYKNHSAEFCAQPSDDPYSHVDPLFAADTDGHSNAFFSSLIRWVKKRVR